MTPDGSTLNRYDLLKLLAIVTMTIDHIGAYLFPDDLWWRVIGRASFPLWLFLVGYASHYRIRRDVLLCGLALIPLAPLCCQYLLPVNILISIVVALVAMRFMAHRQLIEKHPFMLWLIYAVFMLPTSLLFDYGSFAMLFACLGYASKRSLNGTAHTVFCAATFALYALMQTQSFDFTPEQMIAAALMSLSVAPLIYRFGLTSPFKLPPLAQKAGLLLARHSLSYYVIHLIALQFLGAWLIIECF